MPFPVDYRGEVRWRGKTSLRGERLQREVIHALATALTGARGTVTVDGATLSFKTEPGRVGRSRSILLLIAHGSLEVTILGDTVVVAYSLNFQPLVASASVLALAALAALAPSAEPLAVRIGVPAVIWMVVSGVQYPSTIVCFRAFIKRALDRM